MADNALARRYEPTLRDQTANALLRVIGEGRFARQFSRNLLGSAGAGYTGRNALADWTPLGTVFALEEAGRRIGTKGQRLGGVVDAALAAVPIPAAKKGGKTLKAWHGSPKEGLTSIRQSERGALGRGAYLSPHEMIAQRYAGPDGHVYEAELADYFNGLGSMGDSSVNPYQVWRDQMARMEEAAPPHLKEGVAALGAKLSPQDGYGFFRQLSQLHGSEEAAREHFRRAGFTGVGGWADGPEVVMFDDVPVRLRGER